MNRWPDIVFVLAAVDICREFDISFDETSAADRFALRHTRVINSLIGLVLAVFVEGSFAATPFKDANVALSPQLNLMVAVVTGLAIFVVHGTHPAGLCRKSGRENYPQKLWITKGCRRP